MENAIIKRSFVFNSVKIRTAIIDGEPWFIVKDAKSDRNWSSVLY